MKRIISIVLVLCLVLSFGPSVSAGSQLQHNYSQTYNSGIRNETCTTLLGTRVDEYYTGEYTYENLSQLSGNTLLYALRDLMTDTHKKLTTYTNCRDYATKTDCENGDGKSINLIYTGYSATYSDYAGSGSVGWNREHVWPKSLGGFETTRAGSDLHHIRPSDANVNSARSNSKYGYVTKGYTVYGSITGDLIGGTSDGATWQSSDIFEPVDSAKGDVARIVLYVYARWGGEYSKCSNVTNVFQSVDVLLEWCALDPVDTWEMGRNEVVAKIQGNRNVFIDYPELAWLIYDREIPETLTSPSRGSSAPAACTHSETVLYAQKDATCTEAGYTGDTWCSLCSEKLETGTALPALGHTETTANYKDATCTEDGYTGDQICGRCGTSLKKGEVIPAGHTETVINAKAPTCGNKGYTGDTYCSVCEKIVAEGKSINATGEHVYGDWEIGREPTANQPGYYIRYCQNCLNGSEKSLIPAGSNMQPPSSEDDRDQESEGDRNSVSSGKDPDEDRNNESEGDSNSVPSGKDPDEDRNNESEGDRNQIQPDSDSQESTVETIQPTQPETTEPVLTDPTQTTQPEESVPETTAPSPGETTVSTEPSTQAPTTTPSESGSQPESTAVTNTEIPDNKENGSSNGVWILICVIVLAACAAGIIVYFNTGKGKPRPEPSDPEPTDPPEEPKPTDPPEEPNPMNEPEDPSLLEDPDILDIPLDD